MSDPTLPQQLRRHRQAQRLSQLALAAAAGVSQRHLSAIESGRAQAGRAVLVKLAQGLALPLAARNQLLLAGGFAPAYPRRPLDDAALQPVRAALQWQLAHHEPYPATVVDRASHLLMSNASFERVLALVGDVEALWRRCCGDGPRNTLMLTLHPEGLRPHLLNPGEIIPPLLARAAREALTDREARRVYEQVLGYPGLMKAAPPSIAPLGPPVLCERYAVGGARLSLFVLLSSFGTPADETAELLRIESFFPADADSEALLRRLAGDGRPKASAGP